MAQVQKFQGRVASVNKSGVKFEGRDGWHNWSQYAKDGALDKSIERGDVVDVDVTERERDDGKMQYYIQALARVGARQSSNGNAGGSANGHAQQPREPIDPNKLTRSDVLIVRQVCAKAATELVTAGIDAKPDVYLGEGAGPDQQIGYVTAMAEALETWIMRGMEYPQSNGAGSGGAHKERTIDEWWQSFTRGRMEMRKAGLTFKENYQRENLTKEQIIDLCKEAQARITASKEYDALVQSLGDSAYDLMSEEETALGSRNAEEIKALVESIKRRADDPDRALDEVPF